MKKTKDIMRRLLAMGLAAILLAGSVQTGAYAEGKDAPEATTVVSESAEESGSSSEEMTETEETGKGSSEELSDEETEIVSEEETSTEDETETLEDESTTEELSEELTEVTDKNESDKKKKRSEVGLLGDGGNVAEVISGNSTTGYANITAAVTAWINAGNGATLKLLENVTTTAAIVVNSGSSESPMILDLNDHGIMYTGTDRAPVIIIRRDSALELIDSAENKTKRYVTLTDYRGTAVGTEPGSGRIEVTGGYITGGTGDPTQENVGAGVYIKEGSFTMNGGTICGNATGNGGGVYCYHGKFKMNGGTICNNRATGGSGAFIKGSTAVFTLSGGRIVNNTSPYTGWAGIYFVEECTINLRRGEISARNGAFFKEDNRPILDLSGASSIYVSSNMDDGSNAVLTDAATAAANITSYAYLKVDDRVPEPAYTDLLPTDSDNEEALAAKQVSFGGYNWYVIDDDSTSTTEGSLTLFAAGCMGNATQFDSRYLETEINKYSASDAKKVIDAMTQEDGLLAGVADSIKNVDVVTKGYNSDETYDTVSNAKLYLLDTGTVDALPAKVRDIHTYYWLRSPGSSGKVVMCITPFGDLVPDGLSALETHDIRPALQLDLTKVVFVNESKVFMPKSGYSVTLSGGVNATVSGSTNQTGLTGAMTTVTYTADEGYHFEAFEDITNRGITVTRTGDKTVTVSGTPSYNVDITVPNATLGYSVNISGGVNATGNPTEGLSQTGVTGEITPVTYTANDGYGFLEFADITDHGITITRTDVKTVTVSGTPTADVSIIVPDAVTAYYVMLTGGTNATVSGGSVSQKDLFGAMEPVTYTAKEGYAFPEFTDITDHGITVTRTDDKTVTVSGIPTNNVNITVPDAIKPVARVIYDGTSTDYYRFVDAVSAWCNRTGATLTLLQDVEVTDRIVVWGGTKDDPNILDLNDHGIHIKCEEPKPAIYVGNNSNLRLIDSGDMATARYIITDEEGRGIAVCTEEPASGTYVQVNGGYITGAKNSGVYNEGYFELSSGTIIANTSNTGGGLYSNCEFVMTGGAIKYNRSQLGGGIDYEGTFVMRGGEISYNTAYFNNAINKSPDKPIFYGMIYAGTATDGSDAQRVLDDEIAENYCEYGYIKVLDDVFTHDPIEAVTYTGKAITPDVKVYFGSTLLRKDKDYTIKFTNNTNAGTNAKFTITGKGNYKGTLTDTFEIKPASFSDLEFSAIPAAVYNKNKSYKPVPVITYNGKKLKKDKDFKVLQYATDASAPVANPKEPGGYFVVIKGINNYKGEENLLFRICDKDQTPVSKLTVSKIKDQDYTGEALCPEPIIKKGGTVLKKGTDYTLSYVNNTEIGTGKIVISGNEKDYIGTRTVTFKIKGIPMNKVTVEGRDSFRSREYDAFAGEGNKIADLTLTYKANKKAKPIQIKYVESENGNYGAISKDVWCVITYSNIDKAGTATLTLTGVNGCTGTVKKTYKLTPIDVSKYKEQITYDPIETQKYTKSGATPPVTVSNNSEQHGKWYLREGKDYKLSYTNNKQVSDGTGKKAPTVTVKFKGDYKGTLKATFAIEAATLADATTVTAKDVVYTNKAGNWKTSVSVVELSGKKLKAGTDYEKTVKYYKVEGETETELGSKDKVNVGDVIKAVVKAKGKNYTGVNYAEFRVLSPGHDISKLTVSVSPKEFTGREVVLTKEDITFKSGSKVINDVEFEIDQTTYKNNINKGKATVVIRGTGKWGGTKTVTYKIGAKGLSWGLSQ